MLKQKKTKRIAVIGPESTGKTSLCKALAVHYNTISIPEFSRIYIENLKKKYNEEDVLYCIAKQFEQEVIFLKKAKSIMGKVWMEDVFSYCPPWVEKLITEHPYDLYLLTSCDIPYEHDPVRENPLRREFFFEWYKRELITRNLNYGIVSGKNSERLIKAINIIETNLGPI